MKNRISCVLLLAVCIQWLSPLSAKTPGDETAVFEQRLTQALAVGKRYVDLVAPTANDTAQFQGVLKSLEGFALENPQSVFADDARCIALMFDFIDAIVSKKRDMIYLLVEDFEDFIDEYPRGQIEEYTVNRTIRMISEYFTTAYMYIPYRDMLLYLRGWAAWSYGNFEEVIANYGRLKENLDFRRDMGGYLSFDIYNALIESYVQLNRFDEASRVAEEAMKRFPDNRDLRRSVKRFLIMKEESTSRR